MCAAYGLERRSATVRLGLSRAQEIVIIPGGIYRGIFTPTVGAAVSAAYTFIIAVVV
jgi:TRAP-type C4-dicarboxylate transport system permease large subunit